MAIIFMLLSIIIVAITAELFILIKSINEISSKISKKDYKEIKAPSYGASIRKLVSALNQEIQKYSL